MATSDIIVSPATIWRAAVGTALPDETTVIAGAAWGGTWVNMGYTLTPVSVAMNTETFDLTVEQLITPVRTIRVASTFTFSTTLAELTGANLQVALDSDKATVAAGAAQVGWDELTVDASTTDVSLYAFGIEGVRVSDTNARLPVRIFIPRGSITTSGDIQFAKGAGVGIPVTIKALADSSGTALIIHNVTAPKTS